MSGRTPRLSSPLVSAAFISPSLEDVPPGGSAGGSLAPGGPTHIWSSPASKPDHSSRSAVGSFSPMSSSSDDIPPPEIRLYMAIEVVSRLDMAEERRSLSCAEQSLRQFLKAQIVSLQVVVGEQVTAVPPEAKEHSGEQATAKAQNVPLQAVAREHITDVLLEAKELSSDQAIIVTSEAKYLSISEHQLVAAPAMAKNISCGKSTAMTIRCAVKELSGRKSTVLPDGCALPVVGAIQTKLLHMVEDSPSGFNSGIETEVSLKTDGMVAGCNMFSVGGVHATPRPRRTLAPQCRRVAKCFNIKSPKVATREMCSKGGTGFCRSARLEAKCRGGTTKPGVEDSVTPRSISGFKPLEVLEHLVSLSSVMLDVGRTLYRE